MATEPIREWATQMKGFSLPRYSALPDIELYMDQVISLLNKFLAPIYVDAQGVTASMINNYVKLKLVSPPVKKRYTRTQLAQLLIISATKQVLSISEARQLCGNGENEQQMYDDFCCALETAVAQMTDTATEIADSGMSAARMAAARATADKMLAQKLLHAAQSTQKE